VSQIHADLRPYLAVLARRWTVIVPAIFLVPLVALLLAARQQKVYSATAQVLLTYSDPGANLNGLADPYPGSTPDRNVATQAALARDPAVAQEALALSHVHSSANDLLAESSVSSPNGSDLLEFSVKDSPPALATRLATNYALAYTAYRTRIDSQAITRALAGINGQLAQLTKGRQTGSVTYPTLSREQQALIATQASGTSDAVLAQPAQNTVQVGPHPARSAAVGLGVGMFLAVALAFLMETLDQRVAADEIEPRLKIPRLATIPATPRWRREVRALVALDAGAQRRRDGAPLVVLEDPNGREARGLGVLKSSLEFAKLEHEFKSLLFTSARHYDGQAETVANLAMTMAQAGQRVLLCDLSARQPALGDLFGLQGQPGVTELILARTPLREAVVPIDDPSLACSAPSVNCEGPADSEGASPESVPSQDPRGSLWVLPFGGPAPHSGFLGTRAVGELMEQLNQAPYDLVLIDAPPLLASGEAQTLSTLADAVIVALPEPVRPRVLEDLSGALSRLPVFVIGFVTVGTGAAVARNRSAVGGVSAPVPKRDLAPVTSIANGHPHRPAAPPRRVETFRRSPRYADKLRDP
jgi:polysaccharide biosynthesis transport protein